MPAFCTPGVCGGGGGGRYQCKPSLGGPCSLLETFYGDCIAPLGAAAATDYDALCSLHTDSVAAAPYCAGEASGLFALAQEDLAACSAMDDYNTVERFKCVAFAVMSGRAGMGFEARQLRSPPTSVVHEPLCAWQQLLATRPFLCTPPPRAMGLLAICLLRHTRAHPPFWPGGLHALHARLRRYECASYAASTACGELQWFADDCLDLGASTLEAYCEEYVWGAGSPTSSCSAEATSLFALPSTDFYACRCEK